MIAARAARKRKRPISSCSISARSLLSRSFLDLHRANSRQVQAFPTRLKRNCEKRKAPSHIEGYSSAEWILLDYGDFIVHVFSPASRRFYDLERLWRDAKRVEIQEEVMNDER